MEQLFRCIAALLFILSSASGAPTGDASEPDACVRLRQSSTKFNEIARSLSVRTSFGVANTTHFVLPIPWIETKDRCDPGSLRNNPTPCIMKISATLRTYHSEVEKVGQHQVCSEFSKQMRLVMDQFYTDMKTCVSATTAIELPELSTTAAHHSAAQAAEEVHWYDSSLCHYIMERLFSFSILTGRVFAQGDPAGHDPGSTATPCM